MIYQSIFEFDFAQILKVIDKLVVEIENFTQLPIFPFLIISFLVGWAALKLLKKIVRRWFSLAYLQKKFAKAEKLLSEAIERS